MSLVFFSVVNDKLQPKPRMYIYLFIDYKALIYFSCTTEHERLTRPDSYKLIYANSFSDLGSGGQKRSSEKKNN